MELETLKSLPALNHLPRKNLAHVAGVLLFSLVASAVGELWGQDIEANSDAALSSSDSGYLIVQFQDPPIAAYTGGIPAIRGTQPALGSRLDLNSPAAQAYSAYLGRKRQNYKNWLSHNFPAAQVMAEFEIVVNGVAINPMGATATALAKGPDVADVSSSYLRHRTMDVSIGLINARTLWALEPGGTSNAGAGIKIGIIDTGIDETHLFLTDASLVVPPGYPKCDSTDSAAGIPNVDCRFTSNKVIVAKVFQTSTKFDAHAAQDHGTHVSGTAAGVHGTCAPFVGCAMSGVAPKAFLGNYNVFPGNIVSTPSYVIARAIETAVIDGMDVLNLSLGGTVVHMMEVDTVAVNNAVRAGLVVAVAAGNAGPGPGTVEAPGVAANAITPGASTNPHFVGIPITAPIGAIGAALGEFANFVPAITATYTTITPTNGCTSISTSLLGKIALIARGTCSFSTKIRNAQTAGAVGVLIYNNVLGDPTAMAQDGTPNQPTIPAVMVSLNNGSAIASLSPNTVTVDGTTQQEFLTDGSSADILAGFSSRGPSPFTLSIKPDLTAPGVNVYSSVPSFDCGSPPCFAFFQGTSMATPHTAGSAALLLQLHPSWSPAQIKSALVNTAHRPVTSPTPPGAELLNPMDRGSGRIDLASASATPLTFDPVSVSFGLFTGIPPVGFPQSVSVQNVSGSKQSCTASTGSSLVSASPSTLNVGANGRATLTLRLNAGGAVAGDNFGDVTITCGDTVLHVPWWVRIS